MRQATDRPPVWLLTGMPALGVFASSIYLPSIPAMATEFAVPAGQIQLTVMIYLAAMAACMLIVGPLSDRIGRRRIALVTLALFVAGGAAAMLAPNVPTLIAARLMQGAGASGGIVLARAMLRDVFTDVDAARAGATMSTSIAVVPMFAPLVGGWVQQHLGWRANLALVVVGGVVLWLAALRRLVETLPPERRHRGARHTLLTGYARLLRLRAFMAYALPVAFGAAAIFAYQTEAPLLLIGMLHVEPGHYGWYSALPALGFIVGSLTTRRLVGRVPRGPMLQAGGAICLAAGALVVLFALVAAPTPWGIATPMLLFGIGNGFVLTNGSYGSMRAAPLIVGASAALSGCLRMGAGAVGSLLASTLPNGSVVALGGLIMLASAAGLACWRWLGRGLGTE